MREGEPKGFFIDLFEEEGWYMGNNFYTHQVDRNFHTVCSVFQSM